MIIAFIIFLGIVALAIFLFLTFYKPKEQRVYKAKGPYLLSSGEAAFFDALQQSITSVMYICPKVRVADLIDITITKSDKNFWATLNKITQKHVDFVICNKKTFAPLLVIELDGGSHNDPNRQYRDEFIDSVFKQANIPILHITTRQFYDSRQLKAMIDDSINQNTDSNSSMK